MISRISSIVLSLICLINTVAIVIYAYDMNLRWDDLFLLLLGTNLIIIFAIYLIDNAIKPKKHD